MKQRRKSHTMLYHSHRHVTKWIAADKTISIIPNTYCSEAMQSSNLQLTLQGFCWYFQQVSPATTCPPVSCHVRFVSQVAVNISMLRSHKMYEQWRQSRFKCHEILLSQILSEGNGKNPYHIEIHQLFSGLRAFRCFSPFHTRTQPCSLYQFIRFNTKF